MSKKITNYEFIEPLFDLSSITEDISKIELKFTSDDYNKKIRDSLIDANNDNEAVGSFLNEYKDSPATLRSYSKEIERLLLWCIHIVKLNISSLRRDHLIQYQEFLRNPNPKKQWCGPSVSRTNKDGSLNKNWRPFVKGLAASSTNKTLTIIDSFFNYLVQTNYLTGNPLAIDKRRKKRNKITQQVIDRYLELDEINAVLNALEIRKSDDPQKYFQVLRARYIILLLFYTGLRLAEAAEHNMGNFIQREGNWFLKVIGKGKKMREIPIPDELLDVLAKFRTEIGLQSIRPKFREKTPLIPMQNLKSPISSRRIDQIIRWAFDLGASSIESHEPRKASKLRAASAHWLRHSYVTYLLDSGASLKVAQENAGHSNIGTTMHYRHLAQTDRHEATRGLSLKKVNINNE